MCTYRTITCKTLPYTVNDRDYIVMFPLGAGQCRVMIKSVDLMHLIKVALQVPHWKVQEVNLFYQTMVLVKPQGAGQY